jgi:hypothetical protein
MFVHVQCDVVNCYRPIVFFIVTYDVCLKWEFPRSCLCRSVYSSMHCPYWILTACSIGTTLLLLFFILKSPWGLQPLLLAHPGELLSPLSVRRPSVNFSHFNQLLSSHWANLNQTLVEWSLDGPFPKLCPVIPTSNQDSRQAKNRKKGGWNFNCPLLL